jgi:hypothetical protein
MGTNLEQRGDRLTLARVHAVLGVASAGMVTQITPINPLSFSLERAVWMFSASISLNAFCYFLEANRNAPRIASRPLRFLYPFMLSSAILTTLLGMGDLIAHSLPLAGWLFKLFGVLLLGYVVILYLRGWRGLILQGEALLREVEEIHRHLDELNREHDELERQLDENRRQFEESKLEEGPRVGAISLAQPRDDLLADLDRRLTELARRRTELQARTTAHKAGMAGLERRRGELAGLLPTVLQSPKD